MEQQKDQMVADYRAQIEGEQMRNMRLQASQREQQFTYQKEITQLRFKIA